MGCDRTRRRMLALLGGGLVGLSGCSQTPGGGGNGTGTSTGTATNTGTPTPEPGGSPTDTATDEDTPEETPTESGEPDTSDLADAQKGLDEAVEWSLPPDDLDFLRSYYYPRVVHPSTIAARGSAFDCDFGLEHLTPTFRGPRSAVSVDEVDAIVEMRDPSASPMSGASVATGSFDLGNALPNEDYEASGSYGGFALYDSRRVVDGEPDHVLAVRSGTCIFVNVDEPGPVVESLVDVQGGGGERYIDRQPALGTAAAELDAVTQGWLATIGEGTDAYDKGARAMASGVILGESRSAYRAAVAFSSADAVDKDLGAEMVSPTNDAFGNETVRTEGATVIGTATADTAAIQSEFVDVPSLSAPQLDLEVSYDGETLTLTHNGGDRVELAALVVAYGDTERRFDQAGTLRTGGSVGMSLPDLSAGTTVEIIWRPGCASGGTVLATYTVEE